MKWNILDIDESDFASKWGTGKLTSKLLAASDLSDEQIAELLRGDDHLKLSEADCVQRACNRILQARDNHEKVFVGGDYDCDGVCATAIMKETLNTLGIENGYYIPDRFKEGYGLHPETVQMAYDKGYSLIITVDNGVKAHEALKKAKELGMDVIVTDHHVIEEDIEADIVVHPDYMEEDYAYLCGAGVALELSFNLIGMNHDNLISLAAVASIGDVMPLWRETRKIVKRGIALLKQGIPLSLSQLLYPGAEVDETAVAFNIVPKLNSVGRMSDLGNVNTVPLYLITKDRQASSNYARQLNHINDVRKSLSESESTRAENSLDEKDFQLIYQPDFHEGICGLVAGRIANKVHKPVLVMTDHDDLVKGSGRSVPGFNMFEFFSSFEETVSFGGHEMAVGISVNKKDYPLFQQHIEEKMKQENFVFQDAEEKAVATRADDMTFDNIMDLQRLSPYPKELIKPYFAVYGGTIDNRRETAKTIKYEIHGDNSQYEALLYKRKGLAELQHPSCFIGTAGINRFRGQITLQLIVEDIQ